MNEIRSVRRPPRLSYFRAPRSHRKSGPTDRFRGLKLGATICLLRVWSVAQGLALCPAIRKNVVRTQRDARRLAKTADTPEHARILLNLAKQWRRLADQLDYTQAALNERRTLPRRR